MLPISIIEQQLTTRTFGRHLRPFETIDSTNTFAKQLPAEEAVHGLVIQAEEQTAGRGRLQRTWESPAGTNLLFSVVLIPESSVEKISLLPFAGALAVADAIESVTGLSCSCKWPNDVLVNGKKVCGMLLESVAGMHGISRVVLGIGINVNQEEFPEELQWKATSLRNELGRVVDRSALFCSVLAELEARYDQLMHFPSERLMHDWKMKALLFGKRITVLENEFSFAATAVDVAEDGGLVIRTDEGEHRKIFAGDVSLAYQ